MKFALIGDGKIARYHRAAIEHVGGEIAWVHDPKYGTTYRKDWVNFAVICSPSYHHRQQIKAVLGMFASNVIVEKPMCLPWEPIIDDDRINVVLQLRYMDLPDKADIVHVEMVRDADYFTTWKGHPKLTGGLFFNLFIHYIDLAILLDADFEGVVTGSGTQHRFIDRLDIGQADMQGCYNRMYEAILQGDGVKPKDLFYLHWILERNSEHIGYGQDAMEKVVYLKRGMI